MSFILVPCKGEDLKVNGWNWRPTLLLLLSANAITEEEYERMGANACGGKVDAEKASRVAGVIAEALKTMNPGDRLRADLSVVSEPKKLARFYPEMVLNEIDSNELYSATYEWLQIFVKFCEASGGFEVM